MARIQILQLPPYGLDGESPFALIVDQCTPQRPVRVVTGVHLSPGHEQQWKDIAAEHNRQVWTDPAGQPWPLSIESEQERWRAFAEAIGACAVVFTAEQVDLADETTDAAPAEPTSVHNWHFKNAGMAPEDVERIVNRTMRRGDGGTGRSL